MDILTCDDSSPEPVCYWGHAADEAVACASPVVMSLVSAAVMPAVSPVSTCGK